MKLKLFLRTRQGWISRSMQLRNIPVAAFSNTNLFLDRISLDSRGSAMTNHKKPIDVTASLDRNCLSQFTKETVY